MQGFNQLSDLALLKDTDLQDAVCAPISLSLSHSLSLSLSGQMLICWEILVGCYP